MGIYINGMEMPRNCDDCRFDIDCAYDESQDGYKMIGGRPRKCPLVPAADMQPVVTCINCLYNNACLTQAFIEEASRVPFDRNTFFCADGKRANDV